jgi:hypothetical protein
VKKAIIILSLLFPVLCYSQITPIEVPKDISKEERPRVLKLLNQIYNNVSDSDIKFGITSYPLKYSYRGFFIKAKILKNQEPVELFICLKDGDCNACHEAKMTTINTDDTLIDLIDITGRYDNIFANFIDYNNNNCVFFTNYEGTHAGSSHAMCEIYRLNFKRRFQRIYSKKLTLGEQFGYDVGIGVTLTALDKSGYGDIVVKEYVKPHAVPTESAWYEPHSFDLTPPPTVDQTITISMKKYEYEDIINSIKWFFEDLFNKKK